MKDKFKGSITCYEASESHTTLLEINPVQYFKEQPLKWVTGSDSADIGDGVGEQHYSWVEFSFKNDVSKKVLNLPDAFPDNEWSIKIDD